MSVSIEEKSTIQNFPERSALFSPEPMAQGTALREGLRSYFIRVARQHFISPQYLIRMAFSNGKKMDFNRYFKNSAWFSDFRTVDGLASHARTISSVLEKLTMRRGLHRLTLIPWASVIPHICHGLAREHPVWCRECFRQWRNEKTTAYLPLAWSINLKANCSVHSTPLRVACPHCQKTQPWIPRLPEIERCDQCHEWLGFADNKASPSNCTKERETPPPWVSAIIDQFLEDADRAEKEVTVESARASIKCLANDISPSRKAFCRGLGFADHTLNGWLGKKRKPTLSSLLRLCKATNLRPIELLTYQRHHVEEFRLIPPITLEKTPDLTGRAKRRKIDIRQRANIERALKQYLAQDKPIPSAIEITEMFRATENYLRYWFPEVVALLSVKRASQERERKNLIYEKQRRLVRKCVLELRLKGMTPSRKGVQRILRNEKIWIKRDDLVSTYYDALTGHSAPK